MKTFSPRSLNTCITLTAVFLFAILCAVLANSSSFHSLAAPSGGSPGKSAALNPKAEQTISFPNIPSRTLGDPPFAINPSASSGLEVSVTASGVCTLQGSMVHLTGVGSCTLNASQAGDDDYNEAPSVSRSFFIVNAGETVLDLSSFGATGDGVADDGPALQAALDALADAGGGTLFVPPGRHVVATSVVKIFTGLASSIAIRGVESNTLVDITVAGVQLAAGLNLSSEIYPRTNEQAAVNIGGLKTFLVADIAFVGTPGVDTDAAITLYLADVAEATVHHCEFYGLRTLAPGAGVVFAYRSGLRIEQTKFLGSFGDSSVNTPVVQNIEWKSISLSDVVFADYGLRPELYCKCEGATYSWLTVGNAAATTADSPRREASFQNVFMDEGALTGLFSLPTSFQPPSAPIDLIYISNLRMNVSNLLAWGNYLTGVEGVLIENAKYEWSHNAAAAIQLIDAGNVIIDKTECLDAANRIAADHSTQKLTVISSTYTYLDSQAQTTRTLVVSEEEDPVQFVRTQFEQILGRAPDPAAHFYWSDLLLQCGEDLQCVSDQQNNLTQYLNTAPSANFSISGEIKDEQGSALSGVAVALSGSQSATTQTDAEGRHSFAGLPTSGIYTVKPSRPHYTFQDPERTITTPAGDQTISFDATHNRYQISGIVADGQGSGISGVVVSLSGAQSETSTTDDNGSYSFTVEAEKNYTITPAKAHHTFSPATKTINAIAGNETGNFTGTAGSYVLSGQVTSNGSGLGGVTVTLSGSQTSAVTTGADGNFTFNVAAEGNYIITPALTHFTFNPQQKSFSNVGANENVTFVATLNTHQISGVISNASGGLMSNVTVTLSGSQSATATTNASGAYSFANLPAGGNYTVTPSKANYSFSPASATFTDLSQDHVAGFTGSLVSYVLSGRVTNNAQGLGGVAVALSGSQTSSAVTDANGNFSFNVFAGGSYTITPVLNHFTFTPQLRSYSNVSANSSGDFVATLDTHTISGQVTKANIEMPGVTIALSGSQAATMTTDASGAYSFSNLPAGGNYTITPSITNFEFAPTNKTFTDLGANQTANFSATPKTTIEFSKASYSVTESTLSLTVTVNRAGDTSGVSTVDFATIDDAGLQDCNIANGKASPRCDFNFTISTVQFAAGDTSKTISIPIIDGVYVEGSETFTISLTNPAGALLGQAASATVTITDNDTGSGVNPVSDTDFFIRQHYLDFLGREPDPAGFEGWRNILNNCGITVQQPCDRIEVSSAFFRSPEFQGRGYFVYRFYASVGKVPLYDQFVTDLGALSGFLTDEQLEAEKVAFASEFLDRSEFQRKYETLTSPVAYVDGLLQTVNLPSHPSRQSWIDGLTSGSLTRAQALRALVDSTEMYQKYYNEAFVVMQYFGYLRRTADASYLQWIQTMNSNGGDYRIMVSGFLNSLEYRQRFGP